MKLLLNSLNTLFVRNLLIFLLNNYGYIDSIEEEEEILYSGQHVHIRVSYNLCNTSYDIIQVERNWSLNYCLLNNK